MREESFLFLQDRFQRVWVEPGSQASEIATRLNSAVKSKGPSTTAYIVVVAVGFMVALHFFLPRPVSLLLMVLTAGFACAAYIANYRGVNKTIARQRELLSAQQRAGTTTPVLGALYLALKNVLYTDYMLELEDLLKSHPRCIPLMVAYLKRNDTAARTFAEARDRPGKLAIHLALVADAREVATEMAQVFRNSTALKAVTED
jgi:hypothetical protein